VKKAGASKENQTAEAVFDAAFHVHRIVNGLQE